MSGRFLLDTNIVIAIFAKDSGVANHLAQAAEVFVPSEDQEKFGVNPIEGTSDALLSDEHARLNKLAYDYSLQYNQIILERGAK